jgi:hypothetical protein
MSFMGCPATCTHLRLADPLYHINNVNLALSITMNIPNHTTHKVSLGSSSGRRITDHMYVLLPSALDMSAQVKLKLGTIDRKG